MLHQAADAPAHAAAGLCKFDIFVDMNAAAQMVSDRQHKLERVNWHRTRIPN